MKGLEWRHLKGLHELYTSRQTRLRIDSNEYINQVLIRQKKMIRHKMGSRTILEATPSFRDYFEKELLGYYQYYNNFFIQAGLENNARKTFTEEDLKGLLFVYYNREELRGKLTTEHKFSAEVFKKQNSKYMSSKPSLRNEMLRILGITAFPDKEPKDNTWRIVCDCINPEVIVLCENLDCLKVPVEYKANNIELWYVGGNNTSPLLDISEEKLKLPIFYLCDWDHSGLSIYSRVRKIMSEKGVQITLISPSPGTKTLAVGVKNHKSKWRQKPFSGLKADDFTNEETELIHKLIRENIWIEEQNIDMIDVLRANGYISRMI